MPYSLELYRLLLFNNLSQVDSVVIFRNYHMRLLLDPQWIHCCIIGLSVVSVSLLVEMHYFVEVFYYRFRPTIFVSDQVRLVPCQLLRY